MKKLQTLRETFIEKLKTNTAIPESEYNRIVEILEILETQALSKNKWREFILQELDFYGNFWFGKENKMYKQRYEILEFSYKFYMKKLEAENKLK